MSNIYLASWRINGPIDGISETYYGNFDTRDDARDAAVTTMRIRRCLLADNVSIVSARVSLVQVGATLTAPNAPDAYRIPGTPLVGTPADPGAVAGELSTNIGADAIHVQLTNSEGDLANRHLRYCPDRWTRASIFNPAGLSAIEVLTGVGLPPLSPTMATGTTPAENLTLFLRCLISYYGSLFVQDRFPRRGNQTVGRPKTFVVRGYTYGAVIRPATRRTGRPFGPFRGRRRNRCRKPCKTSSA